MDEIVSFIALAASARCGKSLAWGTANDQINGSSQLGERGALLREQFLDVPIRGGEPRGPVEVLPLLDQVGLERGEG